MAIIKILQMNIYNTLGIAKVYPRFSLSIFTRFSR